MSIAATYVDADTFTVVGDQTVEFHAGRRVKMEGGEVRYGTIATAVFTTLTTINLTAASDDVHASITGVLYGIISGKEDDCSMPIHTHDGDEGSGGSIAAVAANTSKISYPGSADATELNILDGATITTTELNLLDDITVLSGSNTGDDPGLENIVEDTTPDLGGDLDWNSNGMKLTSQTVAGSNGDLVYLSSANTWTQADADAESSCSGMLGIRISATEVLTQGVYTTSGLTAASTYYASTTAGGKTVTAPTGDADIVRVIGYALSTTEFFFDPDKTFIEIAA